MQSIQFLFQWNRCAFVSLLALGIGPGSKVFIPAFTYTATAEVIALLGAEPAFVDVDEDTYNISCESLITKINQYPKSNYQILQ